MTWKLPCNATLEDVGGTYVVINETGDCAVLNGTASNILEMLLSGQDERTIAQSLTARFIVEETEACSDVLTIIGELTSNDMLETNHE